MVMGAYLQDIVKDVQLNLLCDSSHGAGGIQNGQIEVMLQRRCIDDDGRGVGEVLDSKNSIQPHLWLTLDNADNSSAFFRHLSLRQQFPLLLIPVDSILMQKYENIIANKIAMKQSQQQYANPLPYNVNLLSFRPRSQNGTRAIVRLQHIFAINEHPIYSKPVVVDLTKLFVSPFVVVNVQEMNLTANVPVSTDKDKDKKKNSKQNAGAYLITLNPMEIRTFLVDFQ